MGSAYDKREQGEHAGREQSARAVTGMLKAKAELLRDSAPNVVLALVAGAALAPIAATAAAVGGVPSAILQTVGGVGTNVVSELLMRRLDRWREQKNPPEPAAMADAISGDILAILRRNDVVAAELARQLVSEMEALGGFEAALGAASGELRTYLGACFGDLKTGQRQVLGAVRDVRDEQRRQRAGIEEAVDRLRMLGRPAAPERDGAPTAHARAVPVPVVVGDTAPTAEAAASEAGWRAGAEVMVGDRLYLLHGDLLAQRPDPGQSAVLRQAVARQLIPEPTGDGYAWLRQAAPLSGPAGNAALRTEREALTRERDLLDRVRGITGVPVVRQLATEVGRTTLVVSWPATKRGEPCRTLGATFPPNVPRDRWHLHLLLTGFRELADTLSKLHARGVTHRNLTPDGIIVTANARFMLRDLGLAARPPRPGEGPPDYQAPEQALAVGRARPGPATDVCQLAGITYHLVTGHLAAPRNPVPAHTLSPGLPEAVSDVIAAALGADPKSRPGLRGFRAELAMPRAGHGPAKP
jgi:hypothetical protein